jgi:hypothetical protein
LRKQRVIERIGAVEVEQSAVEGGEGHRGERTIEGT